LGSPSWYGWKKTLKFYQPVASLFRAKHLAETEVS
jgi:hypothetical protein